MSEPATAQYVSASLPGALSIWRRDQPNPAEGQPISGMEMADQILEEIFQFTDILLAF
jgi:hypothetical protein